MANNAIIPLSEACTFCPRCGKDGGKRDHLIPFVCRHCGFANYFGPVSAVGAIVEDGEGGVVMIRRARDPGKGLLGLPGGFIDAGETAEEAAIREVKEEVGMSVRELRFLTTFPNQYVHHGVVAPVLDLFYVATVQDLNDTALEATEVSELLIVEVGEEHLGQMAFESNRLALEMYLRLISE